ncbi:MAG: polysaccharide deacetylase family protein [Acidobacteria bacterium]|nr:polysaccharide deacetylase family protein [Acidobacteriota bacterium]
MRLIIPRRRSREIILLYHRIARVEPDPWGLCVTPEHFVEHLEVLSKYRRIRLDQVRPPGWSVSRGGLSVAITFDDGYADNLHEARRLLERYNTPATFFLAAGYVGGAREFWWDELEKILLPDRASDSLEQQLDAYFALYQRLQPLPHGRRREILDKMLEWCGQEAAVRRSHRMLTAEEVCRLAAGELFEIGAHSMTHSVLAAQPLSDQSWEVRESKACLENLLSRPVTSFSYPFGGRDHYTAETVQVVRDAGFSRACSTAGHAVSRTDGPFELPRLNVTDMDGDQFERFLSS